MRLTKIKESLQIKRSDYTFKPLKGVSAANADSMEIGVDKQTGRKYYFKGYEDTSWNKEIAGFVEHTTINIMRYFSGYTNFIKLPRVTKLSYEEDEGQFKLASSSFKSPIPFVDFEKEWGYDEYEERDISVGERLHQRLQLITKPYYMVISSYDFHDENVVGKKGSMMKYYMIDFERAMRTPIEGHHVKYFKKQFYNDIKTSKAGARMWAKELRAFLDAVSNMGGIATTIGRCTTKAVRLARKEGDDDIVDMVIEAGDVMLRNTINNIKLLRQPIAEILKVAEKKTKKRKKK